MTGAELEAYLHLHIPLSKAMGVSVLAAGEEGIELAAPLEPNINHRGTAFGGSVSAVAILSAWVLLHVRLGELGRPARLVIQKSELTYLKPIPGGFTAFCPAPPAQPWERFLSALERRGKGRIPLAASVRSDGQEAGVFSGEYVALSQE